VIRDGRLSFVRVNVGCGSSPTPGWVNLDNSPSVRLAAWPLLARALQLLHVLDPLHIAVARQAREKGVQWADATRLPLQDSSVDTVYSCHMLEHLSTAKARAFLAEARRVIRPGGVVRLAVPDLRRLATEYLAEGNADRFLKRTLLVADHASLRSWLAQAFVGPRHHQWMYDRDSLSALLVNTGFDSPRVCAPGETMIENPGALDLREREAESIYIEARLSRKA
jgi:predicted SAM-dependent methyltransferase